jgi:hypothetical protein
MEPLQIIYHKDFFHTKTKKYHGDEKRSRGQELTKPQAWGAPSPSSFK